jgi:uncharacterized membrane protein YozB (DUF420 family)
MAVSGASQAKTNKSTNNGLLIGLGLLIFAAIVGIGILVHGLDANAGEAFVNFLPMMNALLNLTATCLLGTGFFLIKRSQWKIHRMMMITAFGVSIIFLISYVINLSIKGTTEYEGSDLGRIVYYFVLFPHILLAMTVPFLALATLWQAWKNPWTKHSKIARITFPIWMYVSVTGVMVYLMLRVFQW